jgi:integrase
MARKSTGTKYKSRGIWYACITVAQRKRESFAMPTCKTEEQAEERKNIVNDVVQRLRGAGHAALVARFAKEAAERPAGKPLDRLLGSVKALCCGDMVPRDLLLDTALFREVGEMWTSGRMNEKYPGQGYARAGAKDIAGLLEKHVYPHIGELPVSMIRQEHVQLVLQNYPKGNDQDSLRNIGKLTNRVINLAVKPLGIIPSNPLPTGWIPKPGSKKSRTCLYPTEDVQLMACTAVDLGLRVLWGYLHREGHRRGEAFLLRFRNFDLKLGTINLPPEFNKTGEARFWVLSPGVAAMLRAWKRYREEVLGERVTGESLVFFGRNNRPPESRKFHAARTYRENLETAGIDRPQLFEQPGSSHKQVRAHDTRAAFVTVALANGKGDMWISDRTGHSSLEEMKTYRRNARAFIELNLGDWRPVDQLIPELQPHLDAPPAQATAAAAPASAAPAVAAPAPAAPAPEAPTVAAQVAMSAAAPSRKRARRTAAAEAKPGVLPAAEAPAAAAETPLHPLPVAVAEAAPAVVEAAFVADAVPGCEEVQQPHGELAAAAPACTSDEGGWGAHGEAPEAIVGAIVADRSDLRLGAGFVGFEIRRDLPWMFAVQSPPTFGALISSSGTAPALARARRCGSRPLPAPPPPRSASPGCSASASSAAAGKGAPRTPPAPRCSTPRRSSPRTTPRSPGACSPPRDPHAHARPSRSPSPAIDHGSWSRTSPTAATPARSPASSARGPGPSCC